MHRQIRELYERFHVGIFRFSLSMLRDPQLAEDVLQETFLRLLRSGRIPDPGKEQAWLYKTARNLCLDILRKRKREQLPPSPLGKEDNHHLEFLSLISPLPPLEQQILALRFIGGLTHQEIAAIVHLTVAGSKKRYERAIEALRKEMEVTP